ncbi:hypothetical protein K2173_010096 [Erythroxylum novogranatense]|uniref:Uncharacterized protein n=1 Tax=Erythroxylum novogranatense TaxID=1862640 RepID=A0AAV8SBT6_9ROSI|nr:hypothetical protein K2173_010096 [Erythroxylum novogranatense]
MALNNSVTIVETCQVSPFPASEEFSLPLTFFDVFWLNFPSVDGILFYEITDLEPFLFYSTILPKLKHSLSLALFHYLPLAGRIRRHAESNKPIIFYNPYDGITLTIAESDADFNYLSTDDVLDAKESHPYVPKLSITDTDVSVLAAQITLFPNKGFSIGYTMHHAGFDGKSLAMFMKAWSYIHKHCDGNEKSQFQLLQELVPSFDRTLIKDPYGLEKLFLQQWEAITNSKSSLKLIPGLCTIPNVVRATFHLTRENINKLKKIFASQQMSNQLHLSAFVVTCSYVLVCRMKARGGDRNRRVDFEIAVDYRGLIDPPLPGNYFGNCIFYHGMMESAREFMEANGVFLVAEKISGIIKGLKKNLFEGAEEKILEMKNSERGVEHIGVAGSPQLNVYGNDFGWGRPKKVEILSIDRTGSISLYESRDGKGGVEIGLAMPRHEMEAFASLFFSGLKAF